MKISIISPAYENPKTLRIFLESVSPVSNALTCDYEVIIADDGSSSDIKSVIDDFDFVKYVKLAGHAGPAAARNAGARDASGDFLVFFDSDVALKENTLRLFEENFKRGEDVVVGEYDEEPLNKGFFPKFKTYITKSWTPKTKHVSVFALRAAGIKKSIFEDMGGFNKDIKTASVEDYEFADRLMKKGYKIYYDPRILVRHHHPGFQKQCMVFYERSRDIVALLMEKGLRPYDWCASWAEGLSSISGTIFIFTLFGGLFFKHALLWIMSAILFAAFLILNLDFLKAVIKERKIFFLPVAIVVKLALCAPITAGFTIGCLIILKKKLK